MKVTLAYAERQLRHWAKKVEELRLTSNASNAEKEDGKEAGEKENLSPTPPIREKEGEEKGEEKGPSSSSRARAHVSDAPLPAVIDVNGEPRLELVLAFAHRRMNIHDDDLVREWHRIVSQEWFWNHSKTGLHIQNWPAHLRSWLRVQKQSIVNQQKGIGHAARRNCATANQNCIIDHGLPL